MSESKSNENAAASSDICHSRQCMAQNYLLVWVDASIDETNKDCQDTLAQLKNVINNVKLCTQPDQCIQVLNQFDREKAFVITSGSFGQHLVPEIHGIPKLDAIYIFCGDKSRHQGWTQNWTKIKGVSTNVIEICQALQFAVKQRDQNSIAISFLRVNEMTSPENLNQLEPTFMYTQILKDNLLDMQHGEQAVKQFTTYCRNNDCMSSTNINRFEKEYRAELAIWWYTFPSNIYSMLNYALHCMDADIIINMDFFIHDLHQQIQQLHQQQVHTYHDKPFIVYRGQGLSKANFEKLKKTEAGLISFNNFLSTSIEQDKALGLAYSASENVDLIGILFIMSIDPCIKSAPFASIKDKSYFEEEDEILFSMHTVFRVGEIKEIDNENQLYQVELQLTSDDDPQLRLLTNRIREEAVGKTGWVRLANLLIKIGQPTKAEKLYNALFEQTSNEGQKAAYCNQLGYLKDDQGDYEKAISYYEKELEIQQKNLPPNHSLLATSFNNIASMYHKMGKYLKALSFFKNDLAIQEKTLPLNHPRLATSYNNIGSMYYKMGEYSAALSFYERALEIQQKTLPSDHPDLATSYNNIGMVYHKTEEYSKALSFHEKALEIKQNSLPSSHPDFATSYNNIGLVYNKMGQYSKALSFHEKALEIYQKTLPSNHPDLANSYGNIGSVYNSTGEFSKALTFFGKELEIRQKPLSTNHSDLATSYNNIGMVYHKMDEYSKALPFHEKALEICQKNLPSSHPDLVTSYDNIGIVHHRMGDFSKALSFYEKALEIRQKTLPLIHPDFAISYNNIGSVYESMGEYWKALASHEKALEICQKSVPSNHLHLAQSYNNIGSVYDRMGEYSKALPSHEKALEIRQKNLPSNHPYLAQSYTNIGTVCYNLKDYSKALSYYERALDVWESSLPPTHPYIKSVKNGIQNCEKNL
ncbi:unnamed protein product [Adineta steineri]|uniref:NAD(P)(+)--arginine ADP-ribosyltransferase n=1 Tax=Adineta steineri TaxID=433720 RepID=A0A818TSA8_9BILA|nr:unnamed protein product [Adineta steineri]